MAAKYAFWRRPEGTPYRGEDDKHAPTALLSEIASSTSVTLDGALQVTNLAPIHLRQALYSALVIIDRDKIELNEADTIDLVWKSLREFLDSENRTKSPSEFLRIVNRHAAELFRSVEKTYIIQSSISVKEFPDSTISSLACSIQDAESIGVSFAKPKSLTTVLGSAFTSRFSPSKYCKIAVTCRARTHNEAMDRAINAIDYLRGLWSLYITYGRWQMTFNAPSRKIIGIVHVGPIQTVHNSDGTPACDNYWYEPDFIEEQKLFTPPGGSWKSLEETRSKWDRLVGESPFRPDLESLLIRYARALDHVNLNVAFLQLWSLIEKITDSTGTNYDTTIRRATWLYRDRQIAKQLLQYVRRHRNQFVHSATSPFDREHLCYTIKMFLDVHLRRLIKNDLSIKSIADYARVLDYPAEIEELKRDKTRISQIIEGMEQGEVSTEK